METRESSSGFPTRPAHMPGGVRLWRIDLRAHSVGAEDLCTAAERSRADRFVFAADRTRFLAARGALRRLLGQYLGLQPNRVHLVVGPRGKPALAEAAGLHFNLSHCKDEALIAISFAGEVGVDIELMRPLPDALDLARRFFAPDEVAALECAEPSRSADEFLRCWTRKEACLKATGLGLALDTRSFSVGAGRSPRRVQLIAGDVRIGLSLQSVDFDGAVTVLAAVAVVGDRDFSLGFENAPFGRVPELSAQ